MPAKYPVAVKDYLDRAKEQWDALPQVSVEPSGIIPRISRLAQLAHMRGDAVLQEFQLTRGEAELLFLLTRTGRPMTPSEIAADLLTSAAGTTKRIAKLVDAGLVIRTVNPLDGRGALIDPTPAASVLVHRVLAATAQHEAEMIAHLPEAVRIQLAGHLRALLSGLEAQDRSPG